MRSGTLRANAFLRGGTSEPVISCTRTNKGGVRTCRSPAAGSGSGFGSGPEEPGPASSFRTHDGSTGTNPEWVRLNGGLDQRRRNVKSSEFSHQRSLILRFRSLQRRSGKIPVHGLYPDDHCSVSDSPPRSTSSTRSAAAAPRARARDVWPRALRFHINGWSWVFSESCGAESGKCLTDLNQNMKFGLNRTADGKCSDKSERDGTRHHRTAHERFRKKTCFKPFLALFSKKLWPLV